MTILVRGVGWSTTPRGHLAPGDGDSERNGFIIACVWALSCKYFFYEIIYFEIICGVFFYQTKTPLSTRCVVF